MPSGCYENFPITLAEASALGLPVIASRLGAMAEIVEDSVTGLQFTPGDAADLAAKRCALGDRASRPDARYGPPRAWFTKRGIRWTSTISG